ncbi:MAG: DUF547 domain-containing protein [Verrucomicrobiales bacterium]|nr:DUF547 domain-containing protein [Verrucomicrobiales bacterium]
MKSFLFTAIFLLAATAASAFDQSHSALSEILKTYVDEKGMVDYQGLKKKRQPLDSYLKTTGAVSEKDFQKWTQSEQIAFLINVYNAETLQLIIDNYPVTSIKKIGSLLSSPWKQKSVQLFGKTTTLDHVEHGILREKYSEERIHFALVCAAVSCPPLRTGAFTGEQLDAQLDDQARVFLNDSTKNRIEGDTLYLSAIFNWFEGDFTSGGKTLIEYVKPWMQGNPIKVKFNDYDWSLNQQ